MVKDRKTSILVVVLLSMICILGIALSSPGVVAYYASPVTLSSSADIVNTYTYMPLDEMDKDNKVAVASGSGFSDGDLVFIIQMNSGGGKCAAGVFEYARIVSGGNTPQLTFEKPLKNAYCRASNPIAVAQVIRVPEYSDLNIHGRVTAPAWNGLTGGIVVFDVINRIHMDGFIDVRGIGFRGCTEAGWDGLCVCCLSGRSGESYDGVWNGIGGYQHAGAGGGGIMSMKGDAGGGGGAYGTGGAAGSGTDGKDGWRVGCTSLPASSAVGYGGIPYGSPSLNDNIFFGSAGGCGSRTGGGNGGGIAIIRATEITGAGVIAAEGADGAAYSITSGGAGGAVFLSAYKNTFPSDHISVRGGVGAYQVSVYTDCPCEKPECCFNYYTYQWGGNGGVGRTSTASIPPLEKPCLPKELKKGTIYQSICDFQAVSKDGVNIYACGKKENISDYAWRLTDRTVTVFDMLAVAGSGKYADHDYICTKAVPSNPNVFKVVTECNGDDYSYNENTNIPGAAIGNARILGQLFYANLTYDKTTAVPAANSFNNERGSVYANIKIKWEGNSTPSRVIFYAAQSPSHYWSIEKNRSELLCVNRAESLVKILSFDMQSWAVNQYHTILMDWDNKTGIFGCIVDGARKEVAGFSVLNITSVSAGVGASGPLGSASPLVVSVHDRPNVSVFYCDDDAKWKTDLDNSPLACERAGYKWTGAKCCSEADDPNEFYNDHNEARGDAGGACWNSTPTSNGRILNGTNKSIVTVLGSFLGCAINETMPALKTINDTHTKMFLINDSPYCRTIRNVSDVRPYFCSTNGTWSIVPANQDMQVTGVPDVFVPLVLANKSLRMFGCCVAGQCWNGLGCVANQRNATSASSQTTFRCIDGVWINSTPLYTWDYGGKGFCPEKGDCLVNPNGNLSNNYNTSKYFVSEPFKQPACVRDGQWIKQYRCMNSTWSSRTKILAEYLVDYDKAYSPDDYALFCDNFTEVLNFVDYTAFPSGSRVSEYMAGTCNSNGIQRPCVNQFCVSKSRNGVAFAVSLNIPVDDPQNSFMKALGKDSDFCANPSAPADRFYSCGEGIFYNKGLNSVVFVPQGAVSDADPKSIWGRIDPLFSVRFGELVSSAAGSSVSEHADFLSSTSIFDTLYFAHVGAKDLFGFMQMSRYKEVKYQTVTMKVPVDYMGLRYVNTTLGAGDPCLFFKTVSADWGEQCKSQGSSIQFLAFSDPKAGNLRNVWRDLTAKLRLK